MLVYLLLSIIYTSPSLVSLILGRKIALYSYNFLSKKTKTRTTYNSVAGTTTRVIIFMNRKAKTHTYNPITVIAILALRFL